MTPLSIALAAAATATAVVGATTGTLLTMLLLPNPGRMLRSGGDPATYGLDARDVQVRAGTRGWYIERPGASQCVLLVHGRSRARGWMLPLAAAIAQRHSVLVIDLPGHGTSPRGFCTYGVREQEAVRASLDWLCAQGWQRVCAVGTSMGGVAVLLAVTAPSFQGTPADRALAGVVTIGAFTRLTDVLDVVARRNGLPRQAATPLARAAGRIAGYDPADAAPIDHVHRLRAPYLAVQGAQDELVPTHHAGQLATAAPQVGAQAAHYAGGHDEPSNPDLQRIVLGFLDRRAAR